MTGDKSLQEARWFSMYPCISDNDAEIPAFVDCLLKKPSHRRTESNGKSSSTGLKNVDDVSIMIVHLSPTIEGAVGANPGGMAWSGAA